MAADRESVFAIVLAAGRAKRFGSTKQLAPVEGVPLVRRACDVARDVCGDRTVLVTGYDSAAVVSAAAGVPQYLVVNEQYRDGLGSSIATATRGIRHVASAILILLADQPLVTTAHLRAMLEAWGAADDEIVATSFAGTEGPPVLFPRASFEALAELSGERGAHSVMHDPRFTLATVNFEDAAVDIDRPPDLGRL